MRYSLFGLIVVFGGPLAQLVNGDQWVLGGGSDVQWGDVVSIRSQIDENSIPGSIQIRGFTPDQNIITSLEWVYGKPNDVVSEGGAALWDNTAFRSGDALNIVDGDGETSTMDLFKAAGQDQDGRAFILDFGSRVPADSLVFYPRQTGASVNGRPYSEDYVRKHTVFMSDGLSYVNEQPLYSLLRDVPVNSNSIFSMKFPQQFIRFIRLRVGSRNPFEIAEIEMYGNGFVPRATYISKVIDLGSVSNYGVISWAERALELENDRLIELEDQGMTSLSVRMKTGLDNSPLVHFKKVVDPETRIVSQVVVSESEFDGLSVGDKGDIENDTENWSAWSLPLVSGERIPLPSPRPFFQLQIVMESESVTQTLRLDSLVVQHSVPPASAVVGEISLVDDPDPSAEIGVIEKDDVVVLSSIDGGEEVRFAYDVRATIASRDENGFDAIRIDTPTPTEFESLYMGQPLKEVDPDLVKVDKDGIEVVFTSNRIDYSNNVPLRIIFKGSTVIFGTIFSGTVWDTQSEILGQPVLEGDANYEVRTNSLRVALSRSSVGEIVRAIEYFPKILTPNGDGLNDRMQISYTVIQISEPKPVNVEVYDLAGRRVRILADRDQIGGIYSEEWDGRDDLGKMVPPGNYLVLLKVNSGIGTFERVGLVGVAY